MRYVIGLAVIFLAIGCAKKGQEAEIEFPAKIQSFSNFSDADKTKVEEAINKLNTEAKTLVISLDPNTDYHPIYLEKVSEIKKTDHTDASSLTVGYATNYYTNCRIQLKATLFLAATTDLLTTVVWHEAGHCKGIRHNTQETDQIMSEKALELSKYSTDAIYRFLQLMIP